MGKLFEQLVRERDNAAIAACKQRYLDYLHRMLSSMKSIYLVRALYPTVLTQAGNERHGIR
jgi:hypothetical protein